MTGIVFCNILVFIAVIRKPLLATAQNQFILGLAASDFLVGLTIPYHLVLYVLKLSSHPIFDFETFAIVCLLSVLPIFLSCCSSMLHLITIAIDRYLSILYPLEHKMFLTKGKARVIELFLWFVSIIISSAPIYWNNWSSSETSVFSYSSCIQRTLPMNYYLYVLLPGYLIVAIVLIFTYLHIYLIVSPLTRGNQPLKMVGIVISCFFICWLPFVVCLFFYLPKESGPAPLKPPVTIQVFQLIFLLAASNSFMNPIIYTWMNVDFRTAFRQILGCPTNETMPLTRTTIKSYNISMNRFLK